MKTRTIACVAALATAAFAAQASAASASISQYGGNLSGHTTVGTCTTPDANTSVCPFTASGLVSGGPLDGYKYGSKGTLTFTDASPCGVLAGTFNFVSKDKLNVLPLKFKSTSTACEPGDGTVNAIAFLGLRSTGAKGTFANVTSVEFFISLLAHPFDTTTDSGAFAGAAFR